MVAPLQDLLNRINSNTLTPLQQGALATALTFIIPSFPVIDEQGNSVPIDGDILLSREWIAALYSLNALSPSGGSSVSPTAQVAWYINPTTGNDANDGSTPATAVKTAAHIAALWRGQNGGGRPILKPLTGTTITVNILGTLPTSDPLAPMLDVDLDASTQLLFKGGVLATPVTGTIATANVWARTSANGQVRITDAGVADYGPQVGVASLFTRTDVGAVAWLYGPDAGASATGTLTPPYALQIAGAIGNPAHTSVAAAQPYTLQSLLGASLGNGFQTRSFPTESSGAASVYFYRLNLSNADINDSVQISGTATYAFQECQFTQIALTILEGAAIFANSFAYHSQGIVSQGGLATFEGLFGGGISGGTTGTVQARQGGLAILDADFMVFSQASLSAFEGGALNLGDVGKWQNGGNGAIDVEAGIASVALGFAAESIVYGTAGAGPVVKCGSLALGGSQMLYRNDGGGTPAQTQFQFNVSNVTVGIQTSPFGVNPATAAYVGPTTGTLAHLDAALGAGTGFGGNAVDNTTMSVMRIAS